MKEEYDIIAYDEYNDKSETLCVCENKDIAFVLAEFAGYLISKGMLVHCLSDGSKKAFDQAEVWKDEEQLRIFPEAEKPVTKNPEDVNNHETDRFLFEKLLSHVGHRIECVYYGNKEDGIANVSIECEDCNEVLFDVDNPEFEQEE